MIRNTLAKLMIDRNMKATELSEMTGIARSTISKISNNISTKIDFDTLNDICISLEIEPKDFFTFIPINYNFKITIGNEAREIEGELIVDDELLGEEMYNPTFYNISAAIEFERKNEVGTSYEYSGEVEVNYEYLTYLERETEIKGDMVEVKLRLNDNIAENNIYESLPVEFQTQIRTDFTKEIYYELIKKFELTAEETDHIIIDIDM